MFNTSTIVDSLRYRWKLTRYVLCAEAKYFLSLPTTPAHVRRATRATRSSSLEEFCLWVHSAYERSCVWQPCVPSPVYDPVYFGLRAFYNTPQYFASHHTPAARVQHESQTKTSSQQRGGGAEVRKFLNPADAALPGSATAHCVLNVR